MLASIAETDSNGNYRLDDLPPGRYYVVTGKFDDGTYYPHGQEATGCRVERRDGRVVETPLRYAFFPGQCPPAFVALSANL